jgi:hypothetical protein
MLNRLALAAAPLAAMSVAVTFAPGAAAEPVEGYNFQSAAQEITQLFWLAETAEACGWASADDASRFKSFSVRFLAAHLSAGNRAALVSLVTGDGYQDRVRQAAREGATNHCGNDRWRLGWASYKSAADEHAAEF